MDQKILAKALHEAELKIKRAYGHFQEAKAFVEQYVAGEFCRLVEKLDPETGEQGFYIESDPMPPGLALAVGDCFHNLSCSLDYMATGLIRAAGGPSDRITFPSQLTRNDLRDSFKRAKPGKKTTANRRIVETLPGFAMLLLTVIKPYRGGDFSAWDIRTADNIDKHNLLIPTIRLTTLEGVCLEDEENGNIFEDLTINVGAGGRADIIGYLMPGRLKITNKGHPSLSVIFPVSSKIFSGERVLSTLWRCIYLTNEILKLMSQTTFRPYKSLQEASRI